MQVDEKMLALAKKGNEQAFEEIVYVYQSLVYSICYRMLNNTLDAKDVFQEIFIKIYKNLLSCENSLSMKDWIAKITTNCCIDFLKKEKKHHIDNMDEDVEEFENKKVISLVSSEPSPVLKVLKKDTKCNVLKPLQSLSIEYRTIIVLSDIQGFSHEEISKIMQLNIVTVKSKLSRARKKLKETYLSVNT